MAVLLKWYHKLGLGILDKAIIAFILFLVSLDVSKGFSQLGLDLVITLLLVFILYIVVAGIASIPKFFVMNRGKWTNYILGGLAALIIWLLFPKLLELTFAVTNFFGWTSFYPSLPLQDILLYTFVIRAALLYFLSRRLKN